MSESHLDAETNGATATFDYFGRTWTIPNKRHLTHVRAMRNAARLGFGGLDLMIAEVFLSPAISKRNQQHPDQFEALVEIDPDEQELDGFVRALSDALGVGNQGNSEPSSTSS